MSQKKTRTSAAELELGNQERTAYLHKRDDSEETRTVELSFSSEEPYERWWGIEVLGHDRGEVDLSWLASGRAPFLMDHSTRDQRGVIEGVLIGSDRKGRAVVRFGKSDRAEELFQDVLDGIRTAVSVGYSINELRLEKEEDGVPTYRATSWKPHEISSVSIPADATVGLGRSAETGDLRQIPIIQNEEVKTMTEKNTQPAPTPATVAVVDEGAQRAAIVLATQEAQRSANVNAGEIIALGRSFKMEDLALTSLQKGVGVDDFRKLILAEQEKKLAAQGSPVTELGLSDQEARNYSLLRAINAAARNDWRDAGLEREASIAIEKALGRSAEGFFVPFDVLGRNLTAGTDTAGGHLVATDHMAGSFIDMLRNKMMVTQLGARLLSGLVGDVDIPKLVGGATSYWLGEGDNVTNSSAVFGNVTLTPNTIAARTKFSRRLLQQSSPDVESVVKGDLATTIALGIDQAAINGAGGNAPTGIMNVTGIGAVVGGANGGAPTDGHMIDLETEVASDNADIGTLAYLSNAKVRGKLKKTPVEVGNPEKVWGKGSEGNGELNGYKAAVSNQVPSDLVKGSSGAVCSSVIFGNWSDLFIGEWGILDLKVDPYTDGDSGGTIVRAFQDVDVAVRHVESFAAMQDALTV